MLLLIEAASLNVLPAGAARLLATWIARFASPDGITTVGLYRLACACGWQEKGERLTAAARTRFWHTLKWLEQANIVRRLDCDCPPDTHQHPFHLQLIKQTLTSRSTPLAQERRDRRRRAAVLG